MGIETDKEHEEHEKQDLPQTAEVRTERGVDSQRGTDSGGEREREESGERYGEADGTPGGETRDRSTSPEEDGRDAVASGNVKELYVGDLVGATKNDRDLVAGRAEVSQLQPDEKFEDRRDRAEAHVEVADKFLRSRDPEVPSHLQNVDASSATLLASALFIEKVKRWRSKVEDQE